MASHTYFHRGLASWSRRFDAGRTLSVTGAVGYDAPFGLGVQYGTVPTSIDEHSFSYILRALGRWPVNKTVRLDGGVDFEGNRFVIDRLGSPAAVTDPVSGLGSAGVGANGGFAGSASGYTADHLILYTNYVAPFATATVALFDRRLTVTPQFRLQVMTFTGYQGTPDAFSHTYVSPEPRLALRYQVSPRWVAKGGGGPLRTAAGRHGVFPSLR